MHSDDKWGNPKMGQVMNSRGRDAFPDVCLEWEREKKASAWVMTSMIHANEMYQGRDVGSAGAETKKPMRAKIIVGV